VQHHAHHATAAASLLQAAAADAAELFRPVIVLVFVAVRQLTHNAATVSRSLRAFSTHRLQASGVMLVGAMMIFF
jgi:hypothetical protein